MLSLTDIDRWNPEAISAVSRVALTRARGTRSVRATIADTMTVLNWEGDAAAAARTAVQETMLVLDSHADACENVGRAADSAADHVAAIKARLQPIRVVAEDHRLTIDDETGTVRLPSNLSSLSSAEQRRIHDAADELAGSITALLRDAESTDAGLAATIRGADDAQPTSDAVAGPAPNPPPPDSTPAAVSAWWRALSPAAQQAVKDYAPDSIRNLDGIPVAARDELNRAALPRELARLRNGWLDRNGNWHTDTAKLADLSALAATLDDHPDLRLLLLDTTGDPGRVLAAVAVGDVDNAERVGVTVGGMNTSVRASAAGMATEAIALHGLAVRLREIAGLPEPGSVATIAWLGYPTPGLNVDVATDQLARAGARSLNHFFHGLAASSTVAEQHITALGHSYGSLTTSLALQQGAPVDDVVLYGSPGAEITDAAQLGVAPGHAFFEVGMNDLVPELAQTYRFGPPLRDVPGLIELSTQPGPAHDGTRGDGQWHAGAYGHSEYARLAPDGTLRMSGYNLAAVVAGLPEDTITPPPPLIAPGQLPIVIVAP